MIYEKSCGFIVYRQNKETLEYLVVRALNGDRGFPKGHVEAGETELETAIRELKEETHLEVQIVDGFKKEIEYILPNKSNVIKKCVYFLGKHLAGEIMCQESEISDAEFLPFDKALKLLTFEDTRNILEAANRHLKSNSF